MPTIPVWHKICRVTAHGLTNYSRTVFFIWHIEETDEFQRRRKHYAKKRPDELAVAICNLEAYELALRLGGKPLNLSRLGYVHDERHGVYAVDESKNNTKDPRLKKKKLAVTRLVFYPEVETETLWLLTISEGHQSDEIQACHKFVASRRELLKKEQDEANRKAMPRHQEPDP